MYYGNGYRKEMLNYFTQLEESEKKSVVQMLKTFINNTRQEKPVSIAEYNKELLAAEAEFERGEYITHEQLLKSIKAW